MTVGGAFVYVCEKLWKILNNGRMYTYNAVRYYAFFPVDRDDRVIMESQCTDVTHTVSVYHLRMCMQEDNPTPSQNFFPMRYEGILSWFHSQL